MYVFLVTAINGDKRNEEFPKKGGVISPCHEVPRQPRGSSAMEPWEAPLRGWSSSFGGMARSGEHRRWEMGVEWIDVFGFAGKQK